MAAALAAAVAAALGALLLAPGGTEPPGDGPAAASSSSFSFSSSSPWGAAERWRPPGIRMDQALLLVRNELPEQGLRLLARCGACHRVRGHGWVLPALQPARRFASSPSPSSAVRLPAPGCPPAERRRGPGQSGGGGGHAAPAQPAAQRLPGRQRALQVCAQPPANAAGQPQGRRGAWFAAGVFVPPAAWLLRLFRGCGDLEFGHPQPLCQLVTL